MLSYNQNILTMNLEEANQYQYLDEYEIVKQLGSGYQAVVYLALDTESHYVAIKKFKRLPSVHDNIGEEIEAMEALHHENLVKLISVRQNAVFLSKEKLTTNCFAFVLQYVGGGELFDFVADTGKFSQKVTRTYFHQLMNGIHYMHERGYAHRDIKPQNLLLSESYVLKIADFGFSCLLKGRDGKGVLKTKLGTEGYMAPQIFYKEYDGRKTDIFAAGVILFIMYTGSPPFEKASSNDAYYKLIKEKKMPAFWESHSKKRPYGYFSETFKDIFEKMVAFEPSERPTIYDIAKHPWVKSVICTHSEIIKEFRERNLRLNKILQERRALREAQESNLSESVASESSSFRGDDINQQFVEQYFKQRYLKHKWSEKQVQNSKFDIIVKNNDTQFIICMLREYLFRLEIDLQLKNAEDEDLIEAECQSNFMVVEDVQINGENVSTTFVYRSPYGKHEIIHRLVVKFTFGRVNNGNTIMHFEPQGDSFYYTLIRRNIQQYFS